MRNVRRSRRDGLNVERGEGTSITRKSIRGKGKKEEMYIKAKEELRKQCVEGWRKYKQIEIHRKRWQREGRRFGREWRQRSRRWLRITEEWIERGKE